MRPMFVELTYAGVPEPGNKVWINMSLIKRIEPDGHGGSILYALGHVGDVALNVAESPGKIAYAVGSGRV